MKAGISSRELPQGRRTLFLLDEFPAFGKLESIERGMATVRGRGANLWLFLQNSGQLERIYGEHASRSILSNAEVIQMFGSNDYKELDYFSKVIGEEMFDVESVTIGYGVNESRTDGVAETYTVSNSEALGHSQTKGRSSSTTMNSTSGSSSGSSTSSGMNFNKGIFGGQTDRRYNAGTSRNSSSSFSSSQGFSQSTNSSETESRTETQSASRGRTTSENTSRGQSENRSKTIKAEQKPIETPRSLRKRISMHNQLLVVRRHYPFLAPRMNYLIKQRGEESFLFPDMAWLSGIDILERLRQDPRIAEGLGAAKPPTLTDLPKAGPHPDGRLEDAGLGKLAQTERCLESLNAALGWWARWRSELTLQRTAMFEFYQNHAYLYRLLAPNFRIDAFEGGWLHRKLPTDAVPDHCKKYWKLPLLNDQFVKNVRKVWNIGGRSFDWLLEYHERPVAGLMNNVRSGVNELADLARISHHAW
jgi:hypothetical protein